ncbi:hypothetical protein FQR65_LT01150 [Abscondita terminalis]|nr:hypothetical protein FQR65_LT01150 [Abscondita terminalis]
MKLVILCVWVALAVAQNTTPFSSFPVGAYPGQLGPFSRFGPPDPLAPIPYKPQPAVKVLPSTPLSTPKQYPIEPVSQQYRPRHSQEFIPILKQNYDNQPGGGYQWSFATGNGITAFENADIKVVNPEEAIKTVQGGYSYTSPEGIPVEVTYTADENGFHPHVVVRSQGERRN